MAEPNNRREIPDDLSPVIEQGLLNLALEYESVMLIKGSVGSDFASIKQDSELVSEINRKYDEWLSSRKI